MVSGSLLPRPTLVRFAFPEAETARGGPGCLAVSRQCVSLRASHPEYIELALVQTASTPDRDKDRCGGWSAMPTT